MPSDPKIFVIAAVAGTLPALIWLWFWLQEDKEKPEPKGLVFLTFILGSISVLLVLPLEKMATVFFASKIVLIFSLATIEEVFKFAAASIIALKSSFDDQPIDPAMYMITAAVGFAALENFLFLLQPLSLGQTSVGLMTGNLRFLGATLLHTTASALVGIALGLAFFKSKAERFVAFLIGLSAAIGLHTAFNFYIMKQGGENFLQVFGFLWVVTVIILLLFEKLRRMSGLGQKIIAENTQLQTN